MFVPGLREKNFSLGQQDQQGCVTKIPNGKLLVYSPSGEFLFSAFLHNGRYFLDSEFYNGPAICKHDTESVMILADAICDNTAELWHCRMGHVNWPGLKHLTKVADGISIAPKHKLSFCACCVMAESTQKPFQNSGVKPSRAKEVFGADVTGPHARSPAGFRFVWK